MHCLVNTRESYEKYFHGIHRNLRVLFLCVVTNWAVLFSIKVVDYNITLPESPECNK